MNKLLIKNFSVMDKNHLPLPNFLTYFFYFVCNFLFINKFYVLSTEINRCNSNFFVKYHRLRSQTVDKIYSSTRFYTLFLFHLFYYNYKFNYYFYFYYYYYQLLLLQLLYYCYCNGLHI